MQHNEPKKSELTIREQADIVFNHLMVMNDVPTLLWELRNLRLMILAANKDEHIDADFIRDALEQAGLGERPIPAENVYLLQNVCYALADKVGELMAMDSHKLLIEDFGSINSTAENLFRVLPQVEVVLTPESKEEGEKLASYAADIANKVAKRVEAELEPKLQALEKENEACQDKLNELYSKLKAYNSSFKIKAGSSLRIKPERMSKKLHLEETIFNLSKALWLDAANQNLLVSMAEYNRDFFHGLMRQYNNFFLTSNQYRLRDVLVDSPVFLLETIRYDALRMIEKKMAAPFQEVNSELLEGAKNSIANTNNIGSVIVKLEELKASYKPRQGVYKMARAAQGLFSDKKMPARTKQTDFQKDVSALLIKYKHLKALSEEHANKIAKENSTEKEPEKNRSPSPSRRGH